MRISQSDAEYYERDIIALAQALEGRNPPAETWYIALQKFDNLTDGRLSGTRTQKDPNTTYTHWALCMGTILKALLTYAVRLSYRNGESRTAALKRIKAAILASDKTESRTPQKKRRIFGKISDAYTDTTHADTQADLEEEDMSIDVDIDDPRVLGDQVRGSDAKRDEDATASGGDAKREDGEASAAPPAPPPSPAIPPAQILPDMSGPWTCLV